MKKLFLFVQGLFTYSFLALPAFAQTVDPCTNDPATLTNPIAKVLCTLGGPKGENLGTTIRNIAVFFIVLAVLIALLYLLYGGLKWITSRGEKDQVEAARNHIIAAIVGLIVVFLAIFIVSLVLAAFGLNFGELKIPTLTTK